MVEEHKGCYKEICYVDGPDPKWDIGLAYCVVDVLIITEFAPVVGNHGKLGPCPRPWRGGGTVR